MTRSAPPITAAGTVVWRPDPRGVAVALVHRPRYNDWSWPKGKLDPHESWPAAAARETWEETGLRVRLGRPLPTCRYRVAAGPKEVRYWSARVVGGDGVLENEVDAVEWGDPAWARRRMTYRRDREQMDALLRILDAGQLPTRAVAVVRHAKALPRRRWDEADPLRPLDERGLRQASGEVPPLLAAYGVTRLLSSPSRRCVQTLTPYSSMNRIPVATAPELSEEGFESDPHEAARALRSALSVPGPFAVCSHGPVLPGLLDELAGYADRPARAVLATAARRGMAKGEVIIAHVHDGTRGPQVLDVERHPPLR